MKLTTILVLAAVLQSSASGFAQKVTLNRQNISLRQVFNEINKQTGYNFLWSARKVDHNLKVSVDFNNTPLNEALKACLEDLPLTYTIEEKTILIREKEKTAAEKQADLFVQPVIKGRVTDEKGEPMAGVSVRLKNSSKGVQTDSNGYFTLNDADGSAVLVFSMLGYKQVEIPVSNFKDVIVLQEDIKNLNTVIVTGYGTQRKGAITGSIASVKGEDIENVPLQSFDKAIQGRAAGVLVQGGTGVPGGAVKVNIRGVGSINAGTDPLYIVDGVQFNSDAPSSRTSTNALAYINPNDIESIEILKDAAAASVYGAQAANGVVLISTKKGKSGKTGLNLNFYQGYSAQVRKLDVLTTQQALNMRMEAVKNADFTGQYSDAYIRAQVLSEYGLFPDLTDGEIAALPTYDWQGEAFKNGQVRNIEMSTSGGTDKTTFYVSGAYNKHDGNVTNIDFEKGTMRFRLNHAISNRLSFDLGTNLSLVTQNGNTGSQGNTTGSASPQYTAVFMPPTIPVYNTDGSFNVYDGMPGTGFNPIQAATVDENIVRHRALTGNFSASYKLLNNLTFRSFYGIDYRFIRADYYRDPRTPNGASVNGYLIDDNTENVNFTTNQTLNYSTVVGADHSISALAGAEYRSDIREYETARGDGFPTYQFRTMQSAAVANSVSGSWSAFRRLGFYGQVNYEYKKRYFLTGIVRYDGSSRFGADNRMGLFPAISAGWDIARESFLDEAWISQLKLRAGFGQTGNDQINNVSSRGFYQGGTSYNGKSAIRLQTIANTQLGWEKNETINLGLDFGLLNNRISGTVEVFRRTSRDLLLDRLLPYTSGFGSVDNNVGELVNKGLEISLNTENIRKGSFSWSSNFNITLIDNKVTELYDGLDFISNTIRVGYPLGIYYRPRYAGVNSANGRPMWYDVNGNITYQTTAADNVPTDKGSLSDYFGGFSNTFRYKGFELSALLHFDMGRYLVNQMGSTLAVTHGNTAARNSLLYNYENRWTTPGQVTSIPRPISGGAELLSSNQAQASTRFLEDASFIRLRDVTFAYQFQPKLLEKIHLSRVRAYITGVNLLTITKWTGYDPEIGVGGTVENNQGIIPQTKSVTAGVQIGI